MEITHIRIKHTKYYLIETECSILGFDVAWPGMLHDYLREIKRAGKDIKKLKAFVVSHFHIDHAGIAGELTEYGIKIGILNTQQHAISILEAFSIRKGLPYTKINPEMLDIFTEKESSDWLEQYGISGRIYSTPVHSSDSISLVLDTGNCLVGDMPLPCQMMRKEDGIEYWDMLLEKGINTILPAHAREYRL
ncbi:MBL fold metallo-hydrolase [Spirochaetia bacterium 38H-sp]|uniref:MBL fold metallo-hydrolase n=1 Tax=Rarispira pelagica TaxID=3141764 RepID=A0ABU9UCN9_9SPIR